MRRYAVKCRNGYTITLHSISAGGAHRYVEGALRLEVEEVEGEEEPH